MATPLPSPRFTQALVRPPSASFADGLTRIDLGQADVALAREQHARYCDALRALGLELIELPPDDALPDSTFVEDTAVVLPREAVVTRPGATSREPEVGAVRDALQQLLPALSAILAPGTVDGGDICEVGELVLIGVSERTNEDGARQLAQLLERAGYETRVIDIRGIASILHLKSGLAWLGGTHMLAIAALAAHPALYGLDITTVAPEDEYAANCVLVNERVLVASGYPRVSAQLRALGREPLELDMSEFRKLDGGLSCLSLRF